MSEPVSALYAGGVTHRRYRPKVHKLAYRVFWLLLDLDEIDALSQRLRLFSRNRFNLFSFVDKDYGDRSSRPLRGQIDACLAEAGIETGGGSIRLLTMPRIFGFAFNPLSVYFCHGTDGALKAILYEVSNTFGERHSYLIPVEDSQARPIRQACAKAFYVSPFMDMKQTYEFRVAPPGDHVMVGIASRDAEGPMLNAILQGERQPLSDATIGRAAIAFPLLTLKVVFGIHWEALFIWLKGAGFRRRPPLPDQAVSVIVKPAAE